MIVTLLLQPLIPEPAVCVEGTARLDTFLHKSMQAFGGRIFNNAHANPANGYSASLSRIFPIKERMRLMINAAAFNLTNSSHYSNPSGTFSSGSFGRITASYNERQVRLGARIEF
jgi:hypothetical protein